MRIKKNNGFWVLLALLSSFGMMIGFLVFNIDVIVFSVVPCFVSWCADQCGYIETGVIPKYAGCVNGVNWFKDRGQWADNDIEPAPGMIIFFDWDNKGSSGPQDGESDHTGIVERVEDGIVYTVEGNSGDSCRENHYAVGYYEILGYGIPAY